MYVFYGWCIYAQPDYTIVRLEKSLCTYHDGAQSILYYPLAINCAAQRKCSLWCYIESFDQSLTRSIVGSRSKKKVIGTDFEFHQTIGKIDQIIESSLFSCGHAIQMNALEFQTKGYCFSVATHNIMVSIIMSPIQPATIIYWSSSMPAGAARAVILPVISTSNSSCQNCRGGCDRLEAKLRRRQIGRKPASTSDVGTVS